MLNLNFLTLETLFPWAERNEKIRGLILTGSRAAKNSKSDSLSDFDIAVIASDFDFIQNDGWLNEWQEYWVCIHDHFDLLGLEIPTRLVIFNDQLKIDFSFHPLEVFKKMSAGHALPDGFNLGCKILLDKDLTLKDLPKLAFKGFLLEKPSEADFTRNVNEFWFEAFHVAKYLARNDLWVAKSRDWSAKTFLLQMLQWHEGSRLNWEFSPKPDGKEMMSWVDAKTWERFSLCFGAFDTESSWTALENTTRLYREIAAQTGHSLNYRYNQSLDLNISAFIEKMKAAPLI